MRASYLYHMYAKVEMMYMQRKVWGYKDDDRYPILRALDNVSAGGARC